MSYPVSDIISRAVRGERLPAYVSRDTWRDGADCDAITQAVSMARGVTLATLTMKGN